MKKPQIHWFAKKAKSNKLFNNNFFNEILPLLAEIASINQILNSQDLKTHTFYLHPWYSENATILKRDEQKIRDLVTFKSKIDCSK